MNDDKAGRIVHSLPSVALLTAYRHLRKRPTRLRADEEHHYKQLPLEMELWEKSELYGQHNQRMAAKRKKNACELGHETNSENCFTVNNTPLERWASSRLQSHEKINNENGFYETMENNNRTYPWSTKAQTNVLLNNVEENGNNNNCDEQHKESITINSNDSNDNNDDTESNNNDNNEGTEESNEKILSELLSRFKDNAKYYSGDEMNSRVETQRARVRRMLVNDAEDVLRCKDKRNVLRYLRCSGLYASFDDRSELYSLVDRLQENVTKNKMKLLIDNHDNDDNNNSSKSSSNNSVFNENDALRLSWLNALESLSQREVRMLWESGLLDVHILEELLADNNSSNRSRDVESSTRTKLINQAEITENQQEDNTSEEERDFKEKTSKSSLLYDVTNNNNNNNNNNNKIYHQNNIFDVVDLESKSNNNLLIEEEFEKFQQIRHLSELTKEIKNYTLNPTLSAPTLELASVLEKVHKNEMRHITLEELRLLEQYEKDKVKLNVSSTLEISKQKEKLCNENYHPNNNVTMNDTNYINSNNNNNNRIKKVDITEIKLDKSLAPANYFVQAIAQHDKKLEEALHALEEVRREVLLDESFQAAIKMSRSMDAHSVFAPEQFGQILRKRCDSDASTTNNDTNVNENIDNDLQNHLDNAREKKEYLSERQKREGLLYKFRQLPMTRAMLTRPHNAADVPYFYGSIRSVIPPRGKYNLPSPALSPHEKRMLYGQLRKHSRHKKFTS